MGNDIIHVEILADSMVLDGVVYTKGQIVPDPPSGVYNNLENARDVELADGRHVKAFCGYKGRPMYRTVPASELKANPAVVDKITMLPGMPSHPDPEQGAKQLGYKASVYTKRGAEDHGMDAPAKRAVAPAKPAAKPKETEPEPEADTGPDTNKTTRTRGKAKKAKR